MTIIGSCIGCIIANLIIITFEHAGSLSRLVWPHVSGVKLYGMI